MAAREGEGGGEKRGSDDGVAPILIQRRGGGPGTGRHVVSREGGPVRARSGQGW
jgi:hypothetical protein